MKLEDIARIANVSKSAASLALNGKPGVSETKRAEILKIAKENDYVPLRKHVKKEDLQNLLKIRFVACTNEGVISKDYDQLPFFKELLSSLSTEVSFHGHSLSTNTYPKENLLDDLIKSEGNDPSDGIIVLGTNLTYHQIGQINKKFKNLVILDTHCNNINCNTVTMNNYLGAFTATQHLIDMGHTTIGYIKGTPRINNFHDRRSGFKEALKINQIKIEDSPVFYLPGMEISLIQKKYEQFLDFTESCTAIFCEDDYIAISVIKTLNKAKRPVPSSVSVIGFDDISESRVIYPELSTVHVPIKDIIQEAISIIERGTQGNFAKKQVFVNASLVLRDSVKNINLPRRR
ncbi:LacI family DNA-binding transcriptional regulator [Vagococcus sp. BWB3-3]|uniref:LacI family DNA-binding transcriptional regulator n=1 Tax=Vagococcus allomyrinae TaxID=2794353 RepID=A0A940P2L0_9ENTE|nr:LacI family DNA-binding transcriptional regulator [Vagococcus allomyrinae]MBP1040294.1 LacI family DNA-binding transcriptional regulator [Vagococcus allomyrinae]